MNDFSDKDNQVIDKLGSNFSIEHLSSTLQILEKLDPNITISDGLKLVVESTQRQANKIFYAFSATDEIDGGMSNVPTEGIAIYNRIGNILTSVGTTSNDIIHYDDVVDICRKHNIQMIHTGKINKKFLTLSLSYFYKDDGYEYEYRLDPLDDADMRILEGGGITIVKLESLV